MRFLKYELLKMLQLIKKCEKIGFFAVYNELYI